MTTGSPRYQVLVEPAAQRKLTKLLRDIQARLVRRMEALADNPRPSGSLKLAGHDSYRIRIGDYRIIYAILDDRLLVLIVDLGHRREIYRDW